MAAPQKAINDLLALFRIEMNDQAAGVWDDTTFKAAIRDAIRASWPYFYVPIVDLTTYTGTNYVASPGTNDIELAVPTAFLPDTTNGETYVPEIWGIEARIYTSSTSPNPYRWFFLTKGVRIDRLDEASPKIYIAWDDGYDYEYRIYGGKPLLVPTLDTTLIAGTENPGCITYLRWKTAEYLHQMKQKAGPYDRRAHGQKRLLAQAEADKAATKYRMRLPYTSLFNTYQ